MKAAQWVGNHSIIIHEWSLARTLKAFSFLALSTFNLGNKRERENRLVGEAKSTTVGVRVEY